MLFVTPGSRVCEGKSTKHPVTEYIPFLWLKVVNERYTVVSIDGFIITNNHLVNGVFKKAEYIKQFVGEELNGDDVFTYLSKSELNVLKKFANVFGTEIFTFIWPKDFPKGFKIEDKCIYSLKFSFENEVTISSLKLISLLELEMGISMLRGYSFDTVKGLKIATSNVECYLANRTKNPWPGDLDAIIYDNLNDRFVALIEFKTHNEDTPVEEEHIGKYGKQDWRRFNVLFDLIDNFRNKIQQTPKLLFIVWGTTTSENHQNVKIDLIERGQVIETRLIARPEFNTFSQELFSTILEMCE